MAKKVAEATEATGHILLAQYEIARRNGDVTAMNNIKTAATAQGFTIS
jgi:hypothetical protein